MKIAVVGLGYWGPNLVRNFLSATGVETVVCCDAQERRLDQVRKRFPGVEVCSSLDELLLRDDIEAVALATPVSSHFPLGLKALEAGKHLLIEKPFTLTVADAETLIEASVKRSLTLMVDHTFIYNASVRKIRELLDNGMIGDILYFDSVRVNLGLFQRDTNVIWDLAPHDLSIMDYLIRKKPIAVSATGMSHFSTHEDIAYITVMFPDNIIAHFHVNWISPVKVRKILIGGTKLMVVYDDMEPSEKIKLYDRGVEIKGTDSVYKALVEYRTGDMFAPHVAQTEALSLMTADFVNAIKTGTRPISDAQSGLNVVRLLEAADQSLKMGGLVIRLSGNGNGNGYRGVSLAEMQECAATRASGDPCPIQLLFNGNKDAAK
jgi:predicted dehydrogenase